MVDISTIARLPLGPDRPLWLVGCGAMGGALLARWLDCGLAPGAVTVIDPQPAAVPADFAGRVVADSAAAADTGGPPALVMLGVKPQIVVPVADAIRPHLPAAPLVVSMLAGVRTATLGQLFPGARLARIMPNTPARIGRGVTGLFGVDLVDADVELVSGLLESNGLALWLDDESRFDAVTALSGSGPAFVFRFIETLAGAGESVGLDAATAARLALQTVAGAAELGLRSDDSPATLRQQVTSPNGTTEAGLDVLDGDGALSSLMRATIRAAAERSRALATAADALIETSLHTREAGRV